MSVPRATITSATRPDHRENPDTPERTQEVQCETRSDVNGTHTNRTVDRDRWINRTHKHRWTEAHHDAVAYTPTDIPSVPFTNVTGSRLRDVFEAFLKECQVEMRGAYSWSDPILTSIATGRLGVAE